MLKRLFEDPMLQVNRLLGEIYKISVFFRKGITIGRSVKFKGTPILQNYGGEIIRGNHSTLYSTAYGYFAHFTHRTRLFVEDGGLIQIGDNVRINGSTLHAREKIVVGDGTLIAANTSIIDSNGHPLALANPALRVTCKDEPAPIIIGKNVWIGVNCVILKGVQLGDGCVVAAGTIVGKEIPPGSIAYGNPMKIKEKND